MRAPLVQQTMLVGICVVVAGCTNPKAGWSSSGNAPSNAASATLPTQSNASTISTSVNSGANMANMTNPSDPTSAVPKIDVGSNFDNLEIVDASLKGKLGILRVGSEQTANDLLSVFAGLKNKTSKPLALEVQTIYKDNLGNPLNNGSWVPMTLRPHEETEYRSSSISPQAVDFLVRVRRAADQGMTGTP